MKFSKFYVQLKLCEDIFEYETRKEVRSPDDVYAFSKDKIGLPFSDREKVVVLYLDVKGKVNGYEEIACGGISSCPIKPSEVFKGAIMANAYSIILMHNHPSGDVTPSSQDLEITKRIYDASKILGITFIDHIIVSVSSYLSLREQGFLN